MAKFQQRHFEAIASVMQRVQSQAPRNSGVELVIRELADLFQQDNPNFDRGRFERACVPGANVKKRAA